MKRWSVKKVVVTAAVLCALGTITVAAAGRVALIGSSSSRNEDFSYQELAAKEESLGYNIKAPEQFTNGYVFDYGTTKHQTARDEAGNEVKVADSVSLTYKKDGMSDVYLNVEGTKMWDGEDTSDQVLDYQGTSLKYSSDHYRFVPPDYQLTEEEQAEIDAGTLFVSYGSTEVEDKIVKNLSWEDGGVQYGLMSFDNSMSAEEFSQMAGEIIDKK